MPPESYTKTCYLVITQIKLKFIIEGKIEALKPTVVEIMVDPSNLHPLLILLKIIPNEENKVIGTRGQGVRVWCPLELTTEHPAEPILRLD